MTTLRFSDGMKGGSGKSTVALCLIDYCAKLGPVLVIDADTTNPDVDRNIEKTALPITRMKADLEHEDGWDDFMGYIEDNGSKYANIVVSLPAGQSHKHVNLETVKTVLDEMKIQVWHYFAMSRSKESINQLLKSHAEGYGRIAAHRIAVLNGYCGDREKFVRWDAFKENTKVKKALSDLRETYLPDLNDAIMDMLREDHQETFSEVAKNAEMKMFRRSKLNSWLKDVHAAIEDVEAKKSALVKESDNGE